MVADATSIIDVIRRGEAILITGAGFSFDIVDTFGDNLPVGPGLAKSIWPIAFGGEDFDGTALADVYQAAKATSAKLLKEQLERHFIVDRKRLPDRYKTWFSLPWHRIYTLNIDDADEAVAEDKTSRPIQILSALNSTPGEVRSDHLTIVHINGRLADFPNMTFSPWDFADRTTNIDPWYQEFAIDVATRPVIVIGSVLDEPPLWHLMKQREARGAAKELRPRSWLVTPSIDLGRKRLLAELNFRHLEKTEAEFFDSVISPQAEALTDAAQAASGHDAHILLDVAEEIRASAAGTADYLLGSAPTWGDVTNGYAADFAFDDRLSEAIGTLTSGTVSVVGSAGSGKTTSLMKAAARLAAQNSKVVWLGRETESSITSIRSDVDSIQPDYLFIDDVDRFGIETASLLKGLQRSDNALVVVVATRSARYYGLRYDSLLQIDVLLEQDRLTDDDAESLLKQLTRGKRLGALVSMTHDERIQQLTKRDDRQLLVTLIEATSGEKFHDRVAGECRALSGVELVIYGVACTAAWADNKPLSTQDLLFASGPHNRNEAMQALRRLENSRLLVKAKTGYVVRHRVVAESAVDYFRNEGLISSWITDLIFLAAAHYEAGNARRSRLGRMLIRLINHQNLRDLVADNTAVAGVYGAAEEWLDHDFHFWLQRGSYEIDFGELPAADNFLKQARALANNDVLVETAWAQLQLKQALIAPSTPNSSSRAREAFDILFTIMGNSKSNSPHTFAVFLIYGLRWLREAPLKTEEKRKLRSDILHYGEKGKYLHPQTEDVQQGWQDASRWIQTNPLV